MIKLLFLLFFSSSAFAGTAWYSSTDDLVKNLSGYPSYPDRHPEYVIDEYIGGYYTNANDAGSIYSALNTFSLDGSINRIYSVLPRVETLRILGWFSMEFTGVDVAGEQYEYYYDWIYTHTPFDFQLCPDGLYPVSISRYQTFFPGGEGACCHKVCLQDFAGDRNIKEMCAIPTASHWSYHFLMACPIFDFPLSLSLSNSEITAITKNKLISESNSKLGTISSADSTKTSILNSIKNVLFGINSQSSNQSNNVNSPIPEFNFLDSPVDLQSISPLISGYSECPQDVSFSVLNQQQYISYEPLCNFAVRVRPFIISAARVAAAWIIFGAL